MCLVPDSSIHKDAKHSEEAPVAGRQRCSSPSVSKLSQEICSCCPAAGNRSGAKGDFTDPSARALRMMRYLVSIPLT